MKKRLLILCLVLSLASCSFNQSNKKDDFDDSNDSEINTNNDLINLQKIVDNYNDNESLSFENYFINKINSNIYNNFFSYNNKNYKIIDKNVVCLNDIEKNYNSTVNTIEELKGKNLALNEIVYVKGINICYQIKNENLGLDIRLDNGLFARAIIYNKSVNLKAFGLKGNGIDDDGVVLQNIFNQIKKYDVNAVELPYGNYLCQNRMDFSGIDNLKIIGNDSTIIVNDTYNDEKYYEFFFNIYGCSNILFSKLNFKYEMTRFINGIKTQIGVHNSNNIEFVDSKYDIPNTTLELNSKEREFTNVDLYTHWENIVINNCTFNNTCDSNAGGSLWIRDFHGNGSKNCKVLNSKFYKIAHDELIAVYMGIIDNVLIKENEFVVPDDGESSSVMNFTLGTSDNHTNISFVENKINTCATGGLIWSKGKNVVINDNEIALHISKKANGNFRAIEAQKTTTGSLNMISMFKNNKMVIDSYLDDYEFQVHILNNVSNVINNEIIVNLKTTDIMLNTKNVTDNKIEINKNCEYVFYNTINDFFNNNIVTNAQINTFFRYYSLNLDGNIEIKNNIFNYNYKENENQTSCLIMLNDLKMNNHRVDFINNNIKASGLNTKSRMLFYAPTDENQISYFLNNLVSGYNQKNNYLKNCIIKFE